MGVRSLLGHPRRRGGPVRPGDHAGQHDFGRARGRGRQGVLLAGRPHRSGGALAARGARPGSGEAVVHLLLDRVLARAAPGRGRVEREVPRQVRPGLGRAPRGDLRTAEGAGGDPAGRAAHAATGRAPRLGLALGRREDAVRAADGGVCRLPGERRLERRPPARGGRGDGRARQHARHLHLRGQRREPGGNADRLLQRADHAERVRPHRRPAALADRAVRRARRVGHRRVRAALRVRLGVGREHAVPVGQAGRLPPRRHAQRHGGRLAGADQGRRRVAQPVHSRHRRRADDPRSRRYPGAQGRGRDRAEADGGDELSLHLRGRERT